MSALLFHNFTKVIGIELLSGLHNASLHVLEKWKHIRGSLSEERQTTFVSFMLGDATAIDWLDGDVVFCNATCFDEHLMDNFSSLATRLKPLSFVITITKKLNEKATSLYFELLEASQIQMHWGWAHIYLYQRSSAIDASSSNAVNDVFERLKDVVL